MLKKAISGVMWLKDQNETWITAITAPISEIAIHL